LQYTANTFTALKHVLNAAYVYFVLLRVGHSKWTKKLEKSTDHLRFS